MKADAKQETTSAEMSALELSDEKWGPLRVFIIPLFNLKPYDPSASMIHHQRSADATKRNASPYISMHNPLWYIMIAAERWAVVMRSGGTLNLVFSHHNRCN